MLKIRLSGAMFAGVVLLSVGARADTVKITPIGSHQGEFCVFDRAVLFEDPTGVRLLYDPGRTTSPTDERLGTVHAVLLSHVHGDHLGNLQLVIPQTGTCDAPATITAVPYSTTALVASEKNAMLVAGGEMAAFLATKVAQKRGVPASTIGMCPTDGLDNVTFVPVEEVCQAPVRPGGTRLLTMTGRTEGVRITTVTAVHTNGVGAAFLSPAPPAGTFGYVGDATGFVLEFSNGLVVYLTGDTGITTDMETVVRRYYHAELMIVNLSAFFATGAREAAFITTDLVKPRSVMPEHTSEVATSGGQLLRPTRTAAFVDLLHGTSVQVVLPLSGVTREFDGTGRCVNCN